MNYIWSKETGKRERGCHKQFPKNARETGGCIFNPTANEGCITGVIKAREDAEDADGDGTWKDDESSLVDRITMADK